MTAPGGAVGRGCRVLVVDDAPEVRMLVELVLSEAGFVVELAEDGPGGLAAARSLPDVVLLDVQLPGLDGPDVLAQLRADPLTADLPVVFLTAGHHGAEDDLLALGASGVLHKPVDLVALPDQVAALL